MTHGEMPLAAALLPGLGDGGESELERWLAVRTAIERKHLDEYRPILVAISRGATSELERD